MGNVGTDAFVRPASEASVRIIPSLRIIPIAVEERRFSAAMRQEEIRALAPARTRASECGMGRDFVSESSGVSVWRKIRACRQSRTRPSQNARRLGHPLCGCVSGFQYPGHRPRKSIFSWHSHLYLVVDRDAHSVGSAATIQNV
jgi:hypothetical protein